MEPKGKEVAAAIVLALIGRQQELHEVFSTVLLRQAAVFGEQFCGFNDRSRPGDSDELSVPFFQT